MKKNPRPTHIFSLSEITALTPWIKRRIRIKEVHDAVMKKLENRTQKILNEE